MVKEEKNNAEGGAKPKGTRFQKSTPTLKKTFKAPTTGLEDKVFNLLKHKHVADLLKCCEAISKYISVHYNKSGPGMDVAIKNMEKSMINVTEVP